MRSYLLLINIQLKKLFYYESYYYFKNRYLKRFVYFSSGRQSSSASVLLSARRTFSASTSRVNCFPENMSAVKDNLILRLVASSVSIADRSGFIIRDVMSGGNLQIVDKGGNDYQTEADRCVQRCILASLRKKFPEITIIGEEEEDTEKEDDWIELGQSEEVMSHASELPEDLVSLDPKDICIWVDPLDGTNEYTQGHLTHVTVLIGMAVKGRAVGGVVHQPYYNHQSTPVGRTIWGIIGLGTFGMERKELPRDSRKIVTTRSHENECVRLAVEACEATDVIKVGGAGFKVLSLIDGSAHAYVFANAGCKRWDTCAPEAILRAMGGQLTDVHGELMDYSAGVDVSNSAGVVATAPGENHSWYITRIPDVVKRQLKSK